jgi:epoxyqueuosine reductase
MDESDFDIFTRGSAIRRLSHEQWLRNVAIALGNAPTEPDLIAALRSRQGHPSALVREHVEWALTRHNIGGH